MAPRVRTIALACCIGWLALACAAPPPALTPTLAPAAPTTAVATATAPAVPTATPAPAAPTLVPAPQQTAAPRALACGDTISRSVVLTTDLKCSGDALIVQASDITIDLGGHTITGPGAGSPTWPQPNLASSGVKISGQRGVTLKNGSFRSFSSAVFLDNTTDSHIEAIDARANYYGIYLKSATNNEVSRSTFRGNIYGLTLYHSHKNTLAENDSSAQTHFSPGGYGIYMYSSNDNMVVGNTFKQNDNWGIWLSDSKNNVFYHNNIISNHPQVSDDSGDTSAHPVRGWRRPVPQRARPQPGRLGERQQSARTSHAGPPCVEPGAIRRWQRPLRGRCRNVARPRQCDRRGASHVPRRHRWAHGVHRPRPRRANPAPPGRHARDDARSHQRRSHAAGAVRCRAERRLSQLEA